MPQQKRGEVLTSMHDDIGHKGTEATRRAISRRYWWLDWNRDVAVWIRSCHACQVRNERKITIPIVPSAPVRPFRQFHLDCAMMVKSRGYIAYVAARCATTGYPEARMLRKIKGKAVASFIFENIICRWGNVDTISTDNGSEFDNELLQALLDDYNILLNLAQQVSGRKNRSICR